MRARYYDPSIHRFTSEDSAEDGLNWYAYCGNNPVMFSDPSGYITEEEIQTYENGKMSETVYDILVQLGERWEKSATQDAKDEIHRLAEKFRNNNYRFSDCSHVANEQLWANGQLIQDDIILNGLAPTGCTWYGLVKNDGLWDYKVNAADWMPNEGYFMFYGMLISTADFGNINYGYTGTALGLTSETLYKGGGKVANSSTDYSPNNYYGDSEVDHYFIQKGIKMAHNAGFAGNINLPVEKIFKFLGR